VPDAEPDRRIDAARAALAAGRLGLARRRLEGALALARRARDPVLLAAVHNQLGMLGKATGDFAAARRHYARALALVRRRPRNDRLRLADLYHNLGGLEHARGRPHLGEPLARRAVQLRARAEGPDATATWLDRTAHAALLADLGRTAEAAAIYRAALPRFRRRFGAGHYEVAVTLNNLGCACADLGRPAEAARHLRAALRLKRAEFGDGHVEVALTENNLATVLGQAGRRAEARALLERAARTLALRLGARHPSARACRENLARA
jgi:tetratricopeptide (TPR) repeat protein